MSGLARAVLALAALSLGCQRAVPRDPPGGPRSDAGAASAQAPPSVEYAGCVRVLSGSRCVVDGETELTLWMPESFHEHRLTLDGQPLAFREQVVSGGYRAVVAVRPGVLELQSPTGPPQRWSLLANELSPVLAEAEAAKNAGDFARALQLVDGLEPTAPAVERWLAQGLRARVYLRVGRVEEMGPLLERSMGELFAAGYLSDGARDLFTWFFVLLEREFRVERAAELLELWRDRVSEYPFGRALLDEYAGLLLESSGRWSEALRSYGLAQRRYQRLGHVSEKARVEEREIRLLAELGQTREARARHAQLLPASGDVPLCDRANMATQQAWFAILEVEAGDAARKASVPELLRAAADGERRCGDPELRVTGLVNRGLWALREGELKEARRAQRELATLPWKGTYLNAWVAELEARLALGERRWARARAAFEREAALARGSGALDPELRALLGLAEVAAAQDDGARSEGMLRKALAALERMQRSLPLQRLAHTQLATRQATAQRLAELLVARGRVPEALQVAFASYRSALALGAKQPALETLSAAARETHWRSIGEYQRRRHALDEAAAEDWRLSRAELEIARARRVDDLRELESLLEQLGWESSASAAPAELAPPSAGEVRLLVFPLQRDWLVFGQSQARVRAWRAVAPEPALEERATHPLLEPFRSELGQAERIVLLPAGASWEWPFERWKLDGEPLSRRKLSVSAGLATGAVPEPPARPRLPGVVADSRGDLPFSRREGLLVQRAFQVPPERALLGQQVTASALVRLVETSDFLHVAGHARSPESGEPALQLAGGGELALWELHGVRSVPRWVVLSACESAASGGLQAGAGWGWAQQLLALGAESVIAPTRNVADADAFALQEAFYAELERGAEFREAFWRSHHSGTFAPRGAALRLFTR